METAEYILEKVAPLFNKQGYVGTSLAAIEEATGLTKGAIYCNFENKEDLAVKAFEANINYALIPLFKCIESKSGSIEKLLAITNYHREYYDLLISRGGCPLMRVSIDTKFNNPLLFEKAQQISKRLLTGLKNIIAEGIAKNEIKPEAANQNYESVILSIIEGSTFLAFTHNDKDIIINTMNYIDEAIINKIKVVP